MPYVVASHRMVHDDMQKTPQPMRTRAPAGKALIPPLLSVSDGNTSRRRTIRVLNGIGIHRQTPGLAQQVRGLTPSLQGGVAAGNADVVVVCDAGP